MHDDPTPVREEEAPAAPLRSDEELMDRDPSSYSIRDLFRDDDER
jgi:hypothetical protein